MDKSGSITMKNVYTLKDAFERGSESIYLQVVYLIKVLYPHHMNDSKLISIQITHLRNMQKYLNRPYANEDTQLANM